jgi:UDP-N-acetylglucosamine transferase subunit ALG13
MWFSAKLFSQLPKIIRTAIKEQRIIKGLIRKEGINALVSDNRFGVFSKKIPSVYITHQLRVFSGFTTWIGSKLHQRHINKYDMCWIPDTAGRDNLSGHLGHLSRSPDNWKYIGIHSRLKRKKRDLKYDVAVVLSGPEPQRSLLEKKLLDELNNKSLQTILIRGTRNLPKPEHSEMEIRDFLGKSDLEEVINQSELIIARSGYTTIMDLAILQKKAFFIPTPGQKEQEYLARRLQSKGIAPYCKQDAFELSQLNRISNYSGFKASYQDAYELPLNELLERK